MASRNEQALSQSELMKIEGRAAHMAVEYDKEYQAVRRILVDEAVKEKAKTKDIKRRYTR